MLLIIMCIYLYIDLSACLYPPLLQSTGTVRRQRCNVPYRTDLRYVVPGKKDKRKASFTSIYDYGPWYTVRTVQSVVSTVLRHSSGAERVTLPPATPTRKHLTKLKQNSNTESWTIPDTEISTEVVYSINFMERRVHQRKYEA